MPLRFPPVNSRPLLFATTAALSLCTAGCGFIPQDAPNAISVGGSAAVRTAPSERVPYVLVPVNPGVMSLANGVTDQYGGSFAKLRGGNYKDVTIAVGDMVQVTVYEAQSGGLFIPKEASVRPGNFVDIPKQQVDQSGNITIPYAGSVKVAGLTPRAVSDIIRERIKNRAIDPQVVVAVAEQRGNQISVLGEANSPVRFPVDPGGIRVTGAIARAGGPKYPSYETKVTVKRGTQVLTESMSSLVRKPNDDVQLAPGDVVYLSREPRVFMTFGSTPSPGSIGGTNNRRFTFENDTMTLAEAMAKSGGLDPQRANLQAVYVFRFEPRRLLDSSGFDTTAFPGDVVPTVYWFDWSKPDGLFFADSFQVRDHDQLVVSESPSTEILKFLNLTNSATNTAVNINSLR
ncbi:polysaccharide export protein [Bradyrhizobium diazoefficiens]|nr:polysaccharide biosynthesis/export family protein [Bradyrhizobium diazoefficiens]MBR0851316.1 polysaccharide export protein [Bradyrhizobium diazoefficiens]